MSDTAKYQTLLRQRLEQLAVRVDEIEHSLREPVPADFEEQATETEADEAMESLEAAGLAEIAQIKAALARIENGEFGACTVCGSAITPARLDTLPHTPFCINCAAG